MKRTASPNPWLFWFQKMIITSGYVALIAIVAGADISVKNTDIENVKQEDLTTYEPKTDF